MYASGLYINAFFWCAGGLEGLLEWQGPVGTNLAGRIYRHVGRLRQGLGSRCVDRSLMYTFQLKNK
jgi:hypothetical protein